MKHKLQTAHCLTKTLNEDGPYSRKRRLLQFDGWSMVADDELRFESESDVPVYFEGDQGSLRLATPSEISEIRALDGLEKEEFDVDLYFATSSEQKARHHRSNLSEVFVRNKGKEDKFWFPSPTYLFDTETGNVFAANSIDFDSSSFIDGVTVTEDDVNPDQDVCNILNVVTGSTRLFNKDEVEDMLGDRFHALRQVR